MKSSYQSSLVEVLKDEGGYVNHPLDPGGATNKGITQATYDAYRGSRKQSVKLITDAEVADIYKSRYWDVVKADQLPAGLDYAVFDFAVNSGPTRAARFLQSVVGVSLDGQIGPATIQAAHACDVTTAIHKLCKQRLDYLKFLKTWPTFGRGWEARVNRVEAIAIKMAHAAPQLVQEAPKPIPAPRVPPAPSKPLPDSPKPATVLWAWLKSLFT